MLALASARGLGYTRVRGRDAMTDDITKRERGALQRARDRLVEGARRLEQTKVTPTTVLLFMVFLAVLSGAAAGIAYVGHLASHR